MLEEVRQSNYTPKKGDTVLLPALAGGMTIRDAAASAGVAEQTVYRRLKDPAFCRELQATRSRLLDEATGKLVKTSSKAADTLDSLLTPRVTM